MNNIKLDMSNIINRLKDNAYYLNRAINNVVN